MTLASDRAEIRQQVRELMGRLDAEEAIADLIAEREAQAIERWARKPEPARWRKAAQAS